MRILAVVLACGMAVGVAVAQNPEPARVSGGIMAGQIQSKVQPKYPAAAKEQHVSGAVVMSATISKEGAVENLTVVSGPEELRAASLDAVRQWVYTPYLLNGQPVAVRTTITVNYNLGGPALPPPA